jgi:hypothetical protein
MTGKIEADITTGAIYKLRPGEVWEVNVEGRKKSQPEVLSRHGLVSWLRMYAEVCSMNRIHSLMHKPNETDISSWEIIIPMKLLSCVGYF